MYNPSGSFIACPLILYITPFCLYLFNSSGIFEVQGNPVSQSKYSVLIISTYSIIVSVVKNSIYSVSISTIVSNINTSTYSIMSIYIVSKAPSIHNVSVTNISSNIVSYSISTIVSKSI